MNVRSLSAIHPPSFGAYKYAFVLSLYWAFFLIIDTIYCSQTSILMTVLFLGRQLLTVIIAFIVSFYKSALTKKLNVYIMIYICSTKLTLKASHESPSTGALTGIATQWESIHKNLVWENIGLDFAACPFSLVPYNITQLGSPIRGLAGRGFRVTLEASLAKSESRQQVFQRVHQSCNYFKGEKTMYWYDTL